MITIEFIKSNINEKHIESILHFFNATIVENNCEFIKCTTICHCGDSHKLYYYKDTKQFYCYTECGSMDVIELVQNIKDCTIPEALEWLSGFCDIRPTGLIKSKCENNLIDDWDFINRYNKKLNSIQQRPVDYIIYDDSIMNIFKDEYYQGWIDEFISIESMQKYNIKYWTVDRKIIIPQYDIDDNLIGIRGRCLPEDELITEAKYKPIYVDNQSYKNKMEYFLYGLNHNQRKIKALKKTMLVESEKAVMQADTIFGEDNFTLGLCGKNISKYQIDLLLELGVQEVIIGLDKQYSNDVEMNNWIEYIKTKFIKPLTPYFTVNVIWDNMNLLDYKDAPTDKGEEILLKLMKNKLSVF